MGLRRETFAASNAPFSQVVVISFSRSRPRRFLVEGSATQLVGMCCELQTNGLWRPTYPGLRRSPGRDLRLRPWWRCGAPATGISSRARHLRAEPAKVPRSILDHDSRRWSRYRPRNARRRDLGRSRRRTAPFSGAVGQCRLPERWRCQGPSCFEVDLGLAPSGWVYPARWEPWSSPRRASRRLRTSLRSEGPERRIAWRCGRPRT